MGAIVCGRVGDRPWGQTIATMWTRRVTGQLVVNADDKRYVLAFTDGMLVGATSPSTADSLARIALTQHLVIASQVPAIAQRLAAQPGRDEIEVLAELTRLSAEQLEKLRRRVLVQRAARTFALDDGAFEVEPQISIPTRGAADIAEVLFVGARQFLAQDRLVAALRQLGSRFAFAPGAEVDLARFAFSAGEQPVLEALARGTTLPELEARHPELDPRAAYAVVYALSSLGALVVSGAPEAAPPRAPTPPTMTPRTPTSQPVTPRTPTSQPVTARTPTSQPVTARTPTSQPVTARTPTSQPVTARAATTPPAIARTRTAPSRSPVAARDSSPALTPPAVGRAPTGQQDEWPVASRTTSARRIALAARELELIVERKAQMIEQRADHFALLGVSSDAAPDTVLSALALLERQLHPDRLAELHLEALAPEATLVLAAMREAVAVLIDPDARAAYQAQTTTRRPSADPAADAKDAYRRAEMLMRSDRPDKALVELDRACELVPDDLTYRAARAWARFCAATNKEEIANETRKQLQHAASHSDRPEIPTFWLGRVERILGREREALRHFHVVLELQPGHKDAASEVRILEARFRR